MKCQSMRMWESFQSIERLQTSTNETASQSLNLDLLQLFFSQEECSHFSFSLRSKVKHQSKHKSKHKNNVQLIDCLADDCQLSLKHLSVFTQSVNFRLWSRAKKIVDLTESISEVFKQSQSQNQSQIKNQNQNQISSYNKLICQRQHLWIHLICAWAFIQKLQQSQKS